MNADTPREKALHDLWYSAEREMERLRRQIAGLMELMQSKAIPPPAVAEWRYYYDELLYRFGGNGPPGMCRAEEGAWVTAETTEADLLHAITPARAAEIQAEWDKQKQADGGCDGEPCIPSPSLSKDGPPPAVVEPKSLTDGEIVERWQFLTCGVWITCLESVVVTLARWVESETAKRYEQRIAELESQLAKPQDTRQFYEWTLGDADVKWVALHENGTQVAYLCDGSRAISSPCWSLGGVCWRSCLKPDVVAKWEREHPEEAKR
jgi:hypothetical protein